MPREHLAIIRGSGGASLASRPTPLPEPGELLLAPLVSGLCGTDLQILLGERDDPASVLGHEAVARVVAAGAGVPVGLAEGTLVMLNPTNPDDPGSLIGHIQDGVFQQRLVISAGMVAAGLVLPLPVELPLRLAPLIEPLACVLYAFELMARKARQGPLLIYGDGVVGHLVLLAARSHLPAATDRIMIHHRSEGMRWSVDNGMPAERRMLFDGLDGEQCGECAMALLATPRRATLACLADAVPRLAGGGIVDLMGGVPAESRLDALPEIADLAAVRHGNCGGRPRDGAYCETVSSQGKRLTLFGHRGAPNRMLQAAARELAQHPCRYGALVTHLLDLPEAAALMNGYSLTHRREYGGRRFIKVGIRFPEAAKPPRGAASLLSLSSETQS